MEDLLNIGILEANIKVFDLHRAMSVEELSAFDAMYILCEDWNALQSYSSEIPPTENFAARRPENSVIHRRSRTLSLIYRLKRPRAERRDFTGDSCVVRSEQSDQTVSRGGSVMRAVFMAYLTGSIEAVDFYCEAFSPTSKQCFKASDDDDFYAHAEIAINDQMVLAISDTAHYGTEFTKGNNMQFWLTFDDEPSLNRAYDVLKENAEIHSPLAPCEWSKAMADLTDKFGVNWILNVF